MLELDIAPQNRTLCGFSIVIREFKCLVCGASYADQPSESGLCKVCGGTVVITYNYNELRPKISRAAFISRQRSMWRYHELLPISPEYSITMGEGWTPLLKAERLTSLLPVSLFVKNEMLNPTGSFLDRGASIVISYAKLKGFNGVYTDTLGNLGIALAAYCARAGIKCFISTRHVYDIGKVYHALAYGAELIVDRTLCETTGSYYVSPANPLVIEGVKTIAFEIAEQMNWEIPDLVVVPAGNGGLAISIWKGFLELMELGLVSRIPKIAIAQLSTCQPLVKAIAGEENYECRATIAKDIAVANPLHLNAVVKIIRDHGYAVAVSESEVLNAVKLLANNEGILAEPAAATALAGLIRLVNEGYVDRGSKVAVVITGSGLRDPRIVSQSFQKFEEEKVIRRRLTIPRSIGRTKIKILKYLRERPMHSYEIMKRLRDELGRISYATVHQHLNELKLLGLIEPSGITRIGGRFRKLYRLTGKGEQLLKSLGEIHD